MCPDVYFSMIQVEFASRLARCIRFESACPSRTAQKRNLSWSPCNVIRGIFDHESTRVKYRGYSRVWTN